MKKLITKFQPSPRTTGTVPSSSSPASQPTNTNAEAPHHPKQYSKLSTSYAGTKLILDVVKESADVFPPLKSVVSGLGTILKHYDQYITNEGDVRRLIDRVKELDVSLTQPPRQGDSREIERRGILARKLQGTLATLNPLAEQGPASAFLNNVDQASEIVGIVEDIRDAIIDYQTSLQQGLNDQIISLTEIVLLDRLPRVSGAGFDSGNRPKHLGDTQMQVLSTIKAWLRDHGDRQFFWLNGSAGTGKTTISQNVAEHLTADGFLGASFFCSRAIPRRRRLHSIIPTLAFQLAYAYPEFRSYLAQVLTTNPNAGHESLTNQLRKLLIEPLCATRLSTAIVIDALDECEETQPMSTILSLLSPELVRIPQIKLFITSRPEPWIQNAFQLPGLRAHANVLQLQGIGKTDIAEGVKIPGSSQGAPYVVAVHRGTYVTTIGFRKEDISRFFYNAISNTWAKILVDRHRSLEVLLSHGGSHWVEHCKAEVLHVSSVQEADLLHGVYLVACHINGRARIISLATEDIARSVYKALSDNWAKILTDRGQDKVLLSYGMKTYTRECQEAIQELNRNQNIVPLQAAQFFIAYHQSGCVGLIGFSKQAAAQAVYDAVSNNWAKILTNRHSNKPLESHGIEYYVNKCENEVRLIISWGLNKA